MIEFEKTAHYRIVCAALLAWWCGFLYRAFDVRTTMSQLAQAGAATEEGSMLNQVLVFALAGLGVYHLPRAWRVLQSREARNLVLWLLAYLTWAGASLLWSEEPGLTIRRFTALSLMAVGCIGVGAGFYTRTSGGLLTLARHVFYGGLLAVVVLIPPQLAKINVQDVFNPKFNVKDAINIAAIVFPIGYAGLAAILLFRYRDTARLLWSAVFFAILAFMKGRTMLGDVVASGMVLASRIVDRPGLRKLLLTFGLIQTFFLADLGTGGRLFLSYLGSGSDSLADLLPWLSLGEGLKNLTSLSGRLPLWNALYPFVGEHPLMGCGFGAFWNPEHLEQIYSLAGWRAVVAHNGFLDEMLATGIIGLALFLGFWTYGMVLGARSARETETRAGYLVTSWMMLFLLFNTMDSVMQSYFQVPTFISLTALFACMQHFSDEVPEYAGLVMLRPVEYVR